MIFIWGTKYLFPSAGFAADFCPFYRAAGLKFAKHLRPSDFTTFSTQPVTVAASSQPLIPK